MTDTLCFSRNEWVAVVIARNKTLERFRTDIFSIKVNSSPCKVVRWLPPVYSKQ